MTEPSVHGILPPGSRQRANGPLVLALALHGVLIAFVLWHGPRLWTRQNFSGDPLLLASRAGGGGGGGGGERVVFILPPAPAAAPAPAVETPATPVPVPTPVTPPIETPPAAVVAVASTDTAASTSAPGVGPGAGGGTGGGQGGGTGPGTGPGAGPGAGGGEGGGITPPMLVAHALAFERPPKELRGKEVQVTFWVRVDGLVERVDFAPEIADRKFRDYFEELVLRFRFRPARTRDGVAVPSVYTAGFTLPTK